MGRAGIRRRKKKHAPPTTPPEPEDTGIIADLEDQAAWSSYAQDIPRAGNDYRENIRWRRFLRTAHWWRRGNPLTGDWWAAVKASLLVGVVVVGIILLIRYAID